MTPKHTRASTPSSIPAISRDSNKAGQEPLVPSMYPNSGRLAAKLNIISELFHQKPANLTDLPSLDYARSSAYDDFWSLRSQTLRLWWMEISACFIAFISVAAMVATLIPHQHKPLPEWPYQLSVNTLISVYMTILKGTVVTVVAEGIGQMKWSWFRTSRPLHDLEIYDAATRGPLGALDLLWNLRLRAPLSSLGALIAVLILAIDPFAQQVVRYYDCAVPVHGLRGYISKSNTFMQRGKNWKDETHYGTATDWIEPEFQAAIKSGIFAPGSDANFACGTGNCSFADDYSTVGFCSSCQDVTEDLQFHQTTPPFSYDAYNQPVHDANYNYTHEYYEELVQYGLLSKNISITTSLPSSHSVVVRPGNYFNLTAMKVIHEQSSQNALKRDFGKNVATTHVDIIVAKQYRPFDPTTGQPPRGCAGTYDGNWLCNGFGAARCYLYPCVQTYTAEVEVGKLNETRTTDQVGRDSYKAGDPWPSPISNAGPSGFPNAGLFDTRCGSAEALELLRKAGYSTVEGNRWLALRDATPAITHLLGSDCGYWVEKTFIDGIWQTYLNDFFRGSVTGTPRTYDVVQYLEGSEVLKTMYNYGNISFDRVDSIFRNVSDSMTRYIRGAGFNPAVEGVALRDQTCLSVRWGWIAFPTALMLFTLIFFIGVLIQNRPGTHKVPLWKSSPLPLLLNNEDHRVSKAGQASTLEDFERRARKIQIYLSREADLIEIVDEEAETIEKTRNEDRATT